MRDRQVWLAESKAGAREVSFGFDGVFGMEISTPALYNSSVSSLVSSVLQGYNATVFAYGMTGAGKTHTMFGNLLFPQVQDPGLVPLALMDFFKAINQTESCDITVKVSYLEIYNEQIRDLLTEKPVLRPQGLLLLEDGSRGMLIPDLTELPVSSLPDLMPILVAGNSRRTMAPTGANQFSSRSHAVLSLSLSQLSSHSKLTLIDLAGSERASHTDNRGLRLLEGANINRSLLALGNCINLLSDASKRGKFVPYRDSKLTRLLKDSLIGRDKAVMIACISPAWSCYEETVQTLKYAERAGRIRVKAVRNVREVEETGAEYRNVIEKLRGEIEVLKGKLREKEKGTEGVDALGQDLMHNLEEFLELKQSLLDIDSLNAENHLQIAVLSSPSDINRIQSNISDNEIVKNALLTNLQANLSRKNALQRSLLGLKDVKMKDKLELQVAYQALRLEKEDLYLQNQEMRQKMRDREKESEEKAKVIEEMRREMETMRRRLDPKLTKSVSPSPAPADAPTRVLKISNLQDARLMRKTGSKREIKVLDSTEGFLSNYCCPNSESDPLPSERLKANKSIGLKGAFSNLHRVDGKPPCILRSVSVAKERKDKSPLNTCRMGRKTPLAVISNQSLPRYHEDTEKLVRKNFRRTAGETPTVAITLVPK